MQGIKKVRRVTDEMAVRLQWDRLEAGAGHIDRLLPLPSLRLFFPASSPEERAGRSEALAGTTDRQQLPTHIYRPCPKSQ